MKIIGVSNHGQEDVSDILIASNLNNYYGELIVKFLQNNTHDNDTYYPKLVEDDYKLYEYEP